MSAVALLAPLREHPDRSGIILDVDGTLAPIAPRPELASVPEETRAKLRRLVGRYRLVACLSGRTGAEARRLVGVEGIRYVGNHGLELDPRADRAAAAIGAFRTTIDGWAIEDKGLSVTLHYRECEDEAAAIATLQEIAKRAEKAGLEPRWGRKVLEIRPRLAADKGTALRSLTAEAGVSRALYAGDDTTDVDAFRGLGEATLDAAVRIAVSSAETPAALRHAADLVVDGPDGLRDLLSLL